MKNLNKYLKFLHAPVWLCAVLVIVFVLRIPSFFEPYSYGDEMIYLTLGEAVRRGIPLYGGIHDNKPPLLYIIAAISGSLFWFRAVLAIWHLATVFVFWKLTEKLFTKNKKAQIVSTVFFALLTTLPLLEGNIANAEIFMIGPTILAFLLLLGEKLGKKRLITAGVLFSVATLFKVPAVLDIPAIVVFWLVKERELSKKALIKIAKNSFYILVGFLAPILISFVYYFLRGAFSEYLIAAFLQNVGYLSSWRPDDVQKPFFVKNAPLLLRAAVVAVGFLILYFKKKVLSKKFIFVTIWLLLSLFAITLSERPYPHYILQAVPSIALLLGILFTFETLEQTLSIMPLTLAFLVPMYFNFWYYKTTPYYYRFLNFASGRMSTDQYIKTFGDHVPMAYDAAHYITANTKKEEKVFVWGPDSSLIYALSRRLPPGRYVADYHIRDFAGPGEMLNILNSDMPAYVLILPNSEEFPGLYDFLNNNYGQIKSFDGLTIWKLLGPRIRALISD